MKGFSLNALSGHSIGLIHQATLDVLDKTGITVESEDAAALFQGSGAGIEKESHGFRVTLPPVLVEDCIRRAPDHVVLYGRDPHHDVSLEEGCPCFTLFGENVNLIDLNSLKNRSCTKKDLGQATRVADALDEIAVVEKCMGSHDKPAEVQSLHNYEAMVSNTGKHVLHGFFSTENSKKIVDMAAACVGGMDIFKKRPCVTAVVCPTSPLTLVQQCCDVIIATAGLGAGICAVTMPLSGTTSPATLAGTLVMQNAELLSALVLTQLAAKHTAFIYGSCATIMDLKIGNPAMGAPESGILNVATAKLAQYYKLPSWCGSGISSSKLPDAQAAYEFALNTSAAFFAGANLLFSCGGIEYGLTFDYAKLLMDTEHIRNLNTVAGGLEISENTLAMEAIGSVGPGGEFLTHQHTLDHMRGMSSSNLFDRWDRNTWEERTGAGTLTERSYAKARQILETHQPLPLPEGAAEYMRSVIRESEAKLP